MSEIEYYDGPATGAVPTASATTQVPVIVSRATATPVTGAAYLIKSDEEWEPADLRDYILAQLGRYNPSAVARRDPAMEMAVCKAFCRRWGANAPRIARFAFEISKGFWNSAPVDFRRFSQGSDPYFAEIIVKRLPQDAG